MIEREITTCLIRLFQQYPFVTVTGPRQSGKTTLCRSTFPDLEYANLEAPDVRDFAESDPRGFISRLGEGAILDEIQHVPELLSYLQVLADEKGRNGLFVLTVSEQFKLSDAISQSLVGRTALLRLLPLSMAERRRMGGSEDVDGILHSGFYPRIFDQGLDPRQALGDYFETYVERDVRRLGGVRNLSAFRRFVRLCAGRVGQLVNLTSLGSDVGVSHTTAREWLTVLERSYIVFRLFPYYANIGKRLIKAPKLYFYDVGLASHLIGIQHRGHVATHPLRGALFENVAVIEALKHGFNRGRQPGLFFFRDARGLECDLLYEIGQDMAAIEIKAGSTVSSDYFRSLNRVAEIVPQVSVKTVVYGGADRQSRSDCEVVPLADLGGVLRRFEEDQEIAAFVRERRAGFPDPSDVETLDAVFHKCVKPLLDGLVPVRRSLGVLFRTSYPGIVLKHGQSHTYPSGCLSEAHIWEDMRSRIVKEGFSPSDDPPLLLAQSYRLGDYVGKGTGGFDIVLLMQWTLGDEGILRKVTVNDQMIRGLNETVRYSEMATRGPAVDWTVAEINQALRREIESLADA